MSKIFAVAKSGKDVLEPTDPNDFIFHSSYNTFKILKEGILADQSITTNPQTITVAHNQDHVPAFYAFCKFPDGKVVMPDSTDFVTQYDVDPGYGHFSVEADDTNLYFIIDSPSESLYSIDIKYYIFEAPVL